MFFKAFTLWHLVALISSQFLVLGSFLCWIEHLQRAVISVYALSLQRRARQRPCRCRVSTAPSNECMVLVSFARLSLPTPYGPVLFAGTPGHARVRDVPFATVVLQRGLRPHLQVLVVTPCSPREEAARPGAGVVPSAALTPNVFRVRPLISGCHFHSLCIEHRILCKIIPSLLPAYCVRRAKASCDVKNKQIEEPSDHFCFMCACFTFGVTEVAQFFCLAQLCSLCAYAHVDVVQIIALIDICAVRTDPFSKCRVLLVVDSCVFPQRPICMT